MRRPFCCGLPGAMRSGTTPALISLIDSFDSPPAPREANGEPLSERIRQSELAERRIQHRPGMSTIGARQCLATQKIPAVGIGDGQRFAPLAVAGQKPALEV